MIPEQVQLDMGQAKVSFFAQTISSWTLSKLLQSDCLDKKTFFPPVFSCFLLPGYYTRSFPRDVAAATATAAAAAAATAAAATAAAATISPNPIQ